MTEPDVLRRWLLHDLPDTEAGTLEERLFDEDALSTQLHEAEHDLFDDYARGRLDDAQRRALRLHLLATPADRDRLRFARALAARAPHEVQPQPAIENVPMRRWRARRSVWLGLAAACLVAVAIGRVFVPRERSTLSVDTSANVPVVVLMANMQRGATQTPVVLPVAPAVRLQLETPDDGAGPYAVTVTSATGATSFRRDGLRAQQAGPYRYVEIVVPSASLAGARQIALEAPGAEAYTWPIETRADAH